MVTGFVCNIVIRLKACVCSYMIHTEFVCFYVMCLPVYVNKVKNITSVETYFLHTHNSHFVNTHWLLPPVLLPHIPRCSLIILDFLLWEREC